MRILRYVYQNLKARDYSRFISAVVHDDCGLQYRNLQFARCQGPVIISRCITGLYD